MSSLQLDLGELPASEIINASSEYQMAENDQEEEQDQNQESQFWSNQNDNQGQDEWTFEEGYGQWNDEDQGQDQDQINQPTFNDLRVPTPQHLVPNDPILAGSEFHHNQDAGIDKDVVEFMNKLVIHRNAYLDLHAQTYDAQDFYDFNEINMRSGLLQKPNNFLVLGKPGIGLTTFANKFAQKMNLIYISPVSAVEYFNPNLVPPVNINPNPVDGNANEDLDQNPPEELSTMGLEDRYIFDLICQRIQMLDVHHRGYILDGWPMIRSEDISIVEQFEMIRFLPFQPDYIFFMQMEDRDLFRRRVDQKLDPMTMEVYIKKQYIRTSIVSADFEGLNSDPSRTQTDGAGANVLSTVTAATSVSSISSSGLVNDNKKDSSDQDDEDVDFSPLPSSVVGRLISRLEDHPAQVERDFEKFRKAIPAIQAFINSFDRTKVFELNAYWSPTVIIKNAIAIIRALGIIASAIPQEIFRHNEKFRKLSVQPEDGEGYFSEGDEGCIPDPNDPENQEEYPVDWKAVMKAVVVRGRVDPRFRWHISRWKNLCPVALKEGRSFFGKPELAYGLHDKVYFLSSQDAVVKFTFNPRQYLVSSMPSSPVKFFIVGHPLSGKTAFARQLAALSGGIVIDMKKQIRKRLECVKQRYLFKTRFDTTMAAKKSLDKEAYTIWKRHERERRKRVKKWIADYIRRKAADEINKALEAEREDRMKKYRMMRWRSEFHKLQDDEQVFKASPCSARPLAFSYKKFVEDIRKGKNTWSLQEQLELAVELFNAGKLRYKIKRKPRIIYRTKNRKKRRPGSGSEAGEFGEEEEAGEGVDEEELAGEGEEELGEGVEEEEPSRKRKKRKRRKKPYCKKIPPKITEVTVITDDEEPDSSPLFSEDDDEPDESLRMRYPEMCLELTETVPKPAPVCDQDERVQSLVKIKVDEMEKWIATLPSEIYEEIMKMGIRDAEECFQRKFPYAHFSGGWVVENLILDVEKWRSIFRNPDLCPDQVFLLQDTTPDNIRIWNNLKTVFSASNPNQNSNSNPNPHRKISNRKKRLGESFLTEGEDYFVDPATFYNYGNDSEEEAEIVEEQPNLNPDPDPENSLTPDNLQGRPQETPSIMNQLEMDQKRQQSRINSAETNPPEGKHSTLFYQNLGPDNPYFNPARFGCDPPFQDEFQMSSMISDTKIPAECTKPWHTLTSELALGIRPQPTSKNVPFEMKMIVPLATAKKLAHCEEPNQNDEEGKSKSKSRKKSKSRSKSRSRSKSKKSFTIEGEEEIDEDEDSRSINLTYDPSAISTYSDEFGGKIQDSKPPAKLKPESLVVDDLLKEEVNTDERLPTPSGMDSPKNPQDNDIITTSDGSGCHPEDEDCLKEQEAKALESSKEQPVSIKKQFSKQIPLFNDFWNMVYPVISKAKVKHWEVGVFAHGDEKGPARRAKQLWDELESRFLAPARIVTAAELADDETDVKESETMWKAKESGKNKNKGKKLEDEELGEDEEIPEEEENDSDESSFEEEGEGAEDDFENAMLKGLVNKPDAYRKALCEIEEKRLFGSSHFYCPVTLVETHQIRKGSQRFSAKFQDRLYHFVNDTARAKFIENPNKYLPLSATDRCLPPPRICITGAPACGQKEVAIKLAEKAGIYYVNFRDRLQEIIKSRTGSQVGPQVTGEIRTRYGDENDGEGADEEEPEDDEDDEDKLSRLGTATENETETENENEATFYEMEGEDFDPNLQSKELEMRALKSLGADGAASGSGDTFKLESFPMDSVPRAERKADELDKKGQLTKSEKAIMAFLQSGAQLPPAVLEELVRPLWEEEPFKSKGFLLVGFPNTSKDVEYLVYMNCWPEKIYILECDKKTCRQRLMRQTLALVIEQNKRNNKAASKTRKGSRSSSKKKEAARRRASKERGSMSENEYQGLSERNKEELEVLKAKGATTPLSKKIGKALFHYHQIMTKGIHSMKMTLNKRRIEWMSYKTDLSLLNAKIQLSKVLTPALRYRRSILESKYILYPEQAEALVQSRYFHLTRFRRWCPVEIWRGNGGINLWNAPGVTKYPVLYRNYIYYIAGEKNLELFLANTVEMTRQPTPAPVVPFHLIVLGPPKSGKTELCRRIARHLGLHYISETEVIEQIVEHSEANILAGFQGRFQGPLEGPQSMTFATNVDIYLRRGHSVPRYMFYRSLDFALLNPVAQHHGVVFDNYPTEDLSIQELLERGVIPCLIINLELELETALERVERKRRIPNYNFEGFVEDCDELIRLLYENYGPMNSPCIHWYGNEMQCLVSLNAKQNPASIFETVRFKSIQAQNSRQKYILKVIHSRSGILKQSIPDIEQEIEADEKI